MFFASARGSFTRNQFAGAFIDILSPTSSHTAREEREGKAKKLPEPPPILITFLRLFVGLLACQSAAAAAAQFI